MTLLWQLQSMESLAFNRKGKPVFYGISLEWLTWSVTLDLIDTSISSRVSLIMTGREDTSCTFKLSRWWDSGNIIKLTKLARKQAENLI